MPGLFEARPDPVGPTPLIVQSGLLDGTRCVSCRSFAIGFGGREKRCRRIDEHVNPTTVACHRFEVRPGSHFGLAEIEMDWLDHRLDVLKDRLKSGYKLSRENALQRRREAKPVLFEEGAGYIYFLDCREFTKIGFSIRHPDKGRFSGIQTSNPVEVVMWGFARGGQDLEKHLHKWFKARRVRGEWFILTEDDRRELARLIRRTGGKYATAPQAPARTKKLEVERWLIP